MTHVHTTRRVALTIIIAIFCCGAPAAAENELVRSGVASEALSVAIEEGRIALDGEGQERGRCLFRGLAIAGGDHNKENVDTSMHEEVVEVDAWLEGLGYDTTILSNWHDDGNTFDHANFDNIRNWLRDTARLFARTPVGEGCFHELFLFIDAHGTLRAVDQNGNDIEFQGISLDIPTNPVGDQIFDFTWLLALLDDFPSNTIITVLVEACFSGNSTGMADDGSYLDTAYGRAMTVVDRAIESGSGPAGLTIMTSTDGENCCPVRAWYIDSAIDDFLEDVTFDDITDESYWTRFQSMDSQGDELPMLLQIGEPSLYW